MCDHKLEVLFVDEVQYRSGYCMRKKRCRMKHQVDSVDVWILFCSFTHWLVGGAPVPRHVSGCSSGFDECWFWHLVDDFGHP